jgi:hypothetical protein
MLNSIQSKSIEIEQTVLWLEEFSALYYFLIDKGIAITLPSPKGGLPSIVKLRGLNFSAFYIKYLMCILRHKTFFQKLLPYKLLTPQIMMLLLIRLDMALYGT